MLSDEVFEVENVVASGEKVVTPLLVDNFTDSVVFVERIVV